MYMTREEFSEKSATILSDIEDRGAVSTTLDDLRANYYEVVQHAEDVEAERDRLKEENDKLQAANMELFLRVGKTGTAEPEPEEETEPEEPALSYDDLFDDKGELI